MFEDGARTMKTKKLTIHPPARVMPTDSGMGVLGGNHINNSYAAFANKEEGSKRCFHPYIQNSIRM